MRARWCVIAGSLLVALAAQAHESRPAYLHVEQQSQEHYSVLWRVPARGELRLRLDAILPAGCEETGPRSTIAEGGMLVEQWNVRCVDGLVGQEIYLEGLGATLTDALVRFERADGTTQVALVKPSAPSLVLLGTESWQQVAAAYTRLGAEHIIGGVDHLLFVLALLLIVPGWRMLFWTVTAFTLAHSITLAAATLGWVVVPPAPVEAVIALSIMFVAGEIVHWRQGRPGITRRWPWLVAFVFGLLHGFGFAGALSEIGLPEHAIPLALLFFNMGVELGQLAFIAIALLAWAALRQFRWPQWAWRVPVYGIGGVAAFWMIERIAGFA